MWMIIVRCELGNWGGRAHSYAGSSSNSSKDSSISSRSVKEEEGLDLFFSRRLAMKNTMPKIQDTYGSDLEAFSSSFL